MENDVVREGGVGIHFNKKEKKDGGGGMVRKAMGEGMVKNEGKGLSLKDEVESSKFKERWEGGKNKEWGGEIADKRDKRGLRITKLVG